jgi:hypothetical protein
MYRSALSTLLISSIENLEVTDEMSGSSAYYHYQDDIRIFTDYRRDKTASKVRQAALGTQMYFIKLRH